MADMILSCCGLCETEDIRIARRKSKQIDQEIQRDKVKFRRTIKILLLGSGESGKSTFLKQMRIIHGPDFDENARLEFKTTIYGNVVKGMKVLIDARDKLRIPWGNQSNERNGSFVFSYNSNMPLTEPLFMEYLPAMKSLWADTGILTAYDRRREFQLVRFNFI